MLEEIRISDLGVIAGTTLPLGPGLTVLTGETGAGKTMVVTSLALLLGERADAGAVRSGAARSVVEGRFTLPEGGAAAGRAIEAGADLDAAGPGRAEMLVARTVAAGGRSRAHVGGRSVPNGLLGELADDLVAVHGQSEQVLLRSPQRQREVVDAAAGDAVAVPLARYRAVLADHRAVRAELDDIRTRGRERAQEADLLRHGLERVEAVDPRPGEDVALAEEAERLSHVEDLRLAAATAHAALTGEDDEATGGASAVGAVEAARRALEAARDHDPVLAELADRLAEASVVLTEAGADTASHLAGLEADPARLAVVQDRRAELSALVRTYGDPAVGAAGDGPGGVDGVLAWAQGASRRLLGLEGDDDRVVALAARERELADELEELASTVSAARTAAGERLAAAATAELAALAMGGARLVVRVERTGRLGPDGADDVALLLAAHAGADPRPLARGASGGELSRVMLALEVVLAEADPVETFVFDEVDSGVGGRAAVEIGRRLAALAQRAQVLVVTHLPQVAAFADAHLLVEKGQDGSVVASGVRALDDEGRVAELARMLAGHGTSRSAREHAAELLEQARPAGAPGAR
ncbi:DNA repair protein RecN [Pseudokineococcus lusitanus]|uniref:DNA repair protein RecN n=1 Tax=Pseudokineococcus lusitanus TaxID=763993 RepID=A0A3N1G8R5_9ACTN|nr:DNA repair protein RecN [Pseudokineococcus lusitanus]ROP26630.1 DNA replication and repair protein RecN [Pseudokineococcus lusitanus]